MDGKYQTLIYDDDLVDQADFCLQTFFKSYAAAQLAVRILDQETSISAKEILCKYQDDFEKVKFWVDYLLEKNSCSSSTEKP